MTADQLSALACVLGRDNALALGTDSDTLAAIKAAPVVTYQATTAFSADRVATTSLEVTVDVSQAGLIEWLVI